MPSQRATVILIGIICIATSQAIDRSTDYGKPTPAYNGPVACRDEASPCSCYPDRSLLDCRSEEESYYPRPTSKTLFSSNLQTPSADFYPRHVDLSHNEIRSFDQNTFLKSHQRHTIETLDLSRNKLSLWQSGAFDSFDNLRVLNLSHNQIRIDREDNYDHYGYNDRIDEKIWSWATPKLGESLEVLDLSHNQIGALPVGFFRALRNLKRLILDGARTIGTFPSLELPNLEELSLNNCQLYDIPDDFLSKLPKLKKLSLRGNYITSVPRRAELIQLTYLDISENRLDQLYFTRYYELGVGNWSIETLIAGGNRIKTIWDSDLVELRKLKHLDLKNTRDLYELQPNAFGAEYNEGVRSNLRLESLDLSGCGLETLAERMLPWAKLKSLKIGGNQWVCDERLRWLILNSSIPLENGANAPRCYRPKALAQRTFRNVTHEELDNPIETASFFYLRKVVDFVMENQRIFSFALGAFTAFIAMMLLRCVYVCARGICRRTGRAFKKLKDYNHGCNHRMDRAHLLEHADVPATKPVDAETSTIAETLPDTNQ